MSDADRKRLSSLFRDALGEGDVIATPDVLLDDPHVPVLAQPSYGAARVADGASGASSPLVWVLAGVVLLLVCAVGYLLWSRSDGGHGDADVTMERGKAHPAVSLADDEEDDEEVAHITGGVPVRDDALQMQRTQRGMPQMPQMRPTNFQAPAHKKAAAAAPRRPIEGDEGDEGDDDPLFQSLDE